MKGIISILMLLFFQLTYAQSNEVIDFCLPGHHYHKDSIISDNTLFKIHLTNLSIDSTLFGYGDRSLLVFNENFDIEKWIQNQTQNESQQDTSSLVGGEIMAQNIVTRKKEYNENFYYELDSLNRVVFAFRFDFYGEIVPFELSNQEYRTSPAIYEYAYNSTNKLTYAHCSNKHFGKAIEPNWGHGDWIRIFWKKRSIRKIDFYNYPRKVQEWTSRKGISEVHIAPKPREKVQTRLIANTDQGVIDINDKLNGFTSDSIFFRNNYPRFGFQHKKHEDSNNYVLCHRPTLTILSDTSNKIIRYLWIRPDDVVDVFYVEQGRIIKAQHRSTFGQLTTIYPFASNFYSLIQDHDNTFFNNEDESIRRTIIAYKRHRMVLPSDWEFQFFNDSRKYDPKSDITTIVDNQLYVFKSRFRMMETSMKECN